MAQTLPTRTIRSINYGTRAKIGMMFPSANFVAEPQMNAMLPAGVSLHATRLHLDSDNFMSMLERTEEAAGLLADAEVDVIAFHCTGVTMYDLSVVDQVKRRIASVTPIKTVVTADAVVEALERFGATRIVLVTPYLQDTNEREKAFLAHHGVTVLADRGLQLSSAAAFGAVTPQQWYDHVLAMQRPDADAYFLSCTAIKSSEAIDALEAELGKPVISSNQVVLWAALRAAGITEPIPGFGSLMAG
jgi:maleate cis-trans isomerase